jgi:hypothetical protein
LSFFFKLALLKAEKASIKGDYEEAEAQYDIAITSAQSSKFVHEEVSDSQSLLMCCENSNTII